MSHRMSVGVTALACGFAALSVSVAAQQAPAGRGAASPAQGQAEGRGRGAAAAPPAVRPALLFKEEWKQPPYTGELNDENRRVTQDAVTGPRLELKLYGTDARNGGGYEHEG